MEVLEEAAKYSEAFERWCDAENFKLDGPLTDDEFDDDSPISERAVECLVAEAEEDKSRTSKDRLLHLYLAQGFMLKTKINGWKAFCERLHLPPFAHWQLLPASSVCSSRWDWSRTIISDRAPRSCLRVCSSS
jgi:hypothetical protein